MNTWMVFVSARQKICENRSRFDLSPLSSRFFEISTPNLAEVFEGAPPKEEKTSVDTYLGKFLNQAKKRLKKIVFLTPTLSDCISS